MNSSEAISRLAKLGLPVVRTSEAALLLRQSSEAASKTLRRLAHAGIVKTIRHGFVWIAPGPIDPWVALEYLMAPFPAYVSLYSALYFHGVLSQIPSDTYAVSLARSQRIATQATTFSIHHLTPELFGGFEVLPSGVKLATVEKAIFDTAVFSISKRRIFANPPELDLPKRFQKKVVEKWINKITVAKRKRAIGDRAFEWIERS